MTTELEPLWDAKRIYRRLMEDAFVYRTLGSYQEHAVLLEHAMRATANMQGTYLDSLKDREWAWQQEVSSRDKRVAELSVDCALRDKRIAELEELLLAACALEQVPS